MSSASQVGELGKRFAGCQEGREKVSGKCSRQRKTERRAASEPPAATIHGYLKSGWVKRNTSRLKAVKSNKNTGNRINITRGYFIRNVAVFLVFSVKMKINSYTIGDAECPVTMSLSTRLQAGGLPVSPSR